MMNISWNSPEELRFNTVEVFLLLIALCILILFGNFIYGPLFPMTSEAYWRLPINSVVLNT